jgi:hypothetical protein
MEELKLERAKVKADERVRMEAAKSDNGKRAENSRKKLAEKDAELLAARKQRAATGGQRGQAFDPKPFPPMAGRCTLTPGCPRFVCALRLNLWLGTKAW